MRRRQKSRDELFIESVTKTYMEFCDYIENPGKYGYIAVLCKLKPQAKELIKAGLLDIKIKAGEDIRKARNSMRAAMGYYDDT